MMRTIERNVCTGLILALIGWIAPLPASHAAERDAEGFRPLFNGKDLTGWKLRDPHGHNAWKILPGGVLKNDLQPGEHGTDLLTTEKFKDFIVRYEYNVPDHSNSGFYLRGRYEIQILGDYQSGRATRTGNGSLYNFKAPDKFATRPGGQWQTVEATMIGNRITVILNGVKIHDRVLCEHPTGGQIDNRVHTPGPILLQGNHGVVSFRNIRIKELD